jgi:hypothetical protein
MRSAFERRRGSGPKGPRALGSDSIAFELAQAVDELPEGGSLDGIAHADGMLAPAVLDRDVTGGVVGPAGPRDASRKLEESGVCDQLLERPALGFSQAAGLDCYRWPGAGQEHQSLAVLKSYPHRLLPAGVGPPQD